MTQQARYFVAGAVSALVVVGLVAGIGAAVLSAQDTNSTAQVDYVDLPTVPTQRFVGWKHGSAGLAILDTSTGAIRFVEFGWAREAPYAFEQDRAGRDRWEYFKRVQ